MGGGEVSGGEDVVDDPALEAEAIDESRLEQLHGLRKEHRLPQLRPRALDEHGEGDLAVAQRVHHPHPHVLLHLPRWELEGDRTQQIPIVGHARHAAEAQILLLRQPGDGGEVSLHEREQLLLLDVPAQGEDEVGGVAEAAAEEGGGEEHVDLVHVRGLQGHEEVVVGGVEAHNLLREQGLGAPPLVLDLLPRHPQQHRHLILAGLQLGGEEQVDHLQSSLEVRRAALSSEGSRVSGDLRVHRHPHARQHVHQLPRTDSEGSDLAGDRGAHPP
mmetsp:Transcript_6761/g.23766  ORF Transcript_6761/g.23766 Transcript_6761/m.23766 type:complete len:273 (+) Transcript_6761:660-1478(+)